MAFLSGCAARLDPVSLPPEYVYEPAQTRLWLDLESVRSDNWSHILNDGASALEWRLRAIDTATQSIEFQTFLWDLDGVGNVVSSRLLAAADRGVRVRILVDDSFTFKSDATVSRIDSHPNIDYRIFNPFKRRSSGAVTREILNLGEFHRLNFRMHNKVMIVDNRIAIVGGRNIADQYFGLHEKANFRDLEILVGGPIVAETGNGFDRYWNDRWSFPVDVLIKSKGSGPTLAVLEKTDVRLHREESSQDRAEQWLTLVEKALSGTPMLLIDDPPGNRPGAVTGAPIQLESEIADLIDSANGEILIVSAYLIPTSVFEQAIERAEKRGVNVRILTNSIRSNNHVTAHSAYQKHIRQLLEHGADLHEVRVDAKDRSEYMQPPLEEAGLALHAKIMVVDHDTVFIGSANFDPRSLRINTEMGLMITSEALNKQLREVLAPDFSQRNAWQLTLTDSGKVQWISDDQTLDRQPAQSFMQRLEDWFFAHLPIENQM